MIGRRRCSAAGGIGRGTTTRPETATTSLGERALALRAASRIGHRVVVGEGDRRGARALPAGVARRAGPWPPCGRR
jgi:hypothetical protein